MFKSCFIKVFAQGTTYWMFGVHQDPRNLENGISKGCFTSKIWQSLTNAQQDQSNIDSAKGTVLLSTGPALG
jgi:hypothetical protein